MNNDWLDERNVYQFFETNVCLRKGAKTPFHENDMERLIIKSIADCKSRAGENDKLTFLF